MLWTAAKDVWYSARNDRETKIAILRHMAK
jgi:hypothetical protein